jgi:M6 family metalloprotease-like protein
MVTATKTFNSDLRKSVVRRISQQKLLMFLMAGLIFLPSTLHAAPFAKNFQFTQPDRTQITLWGEGDEFHAVFETTTGYTVIFDPQQNAYFFAKRSADGKSLQSTGVASHHQPPPSLGKHERMDGDAAAHIAREKRKKWDTDTELSRRWSRLKAQTLGTPMTAEESGVLPSPPSTATTGAKVGLTLLIDFPDVPATIPKENIDAFLNGDSYTGYNNNGSVKQYFSDVSNATLSYTNVATIYVRMTQPKSYYNDTTKDCGAQGRLLINDALAILKARSDYDEIILPTFASLTTDSSNKVVAFNVYFAGSDSGVWSYGLWPHSWALASSIPLGNGKSVYRYQITDVGNSLELGTFCHENGHMLCGFPDFYDYGYDSSGGAGVFSLMGYGGSGTNPKQVDAYLKTAAGWATATDIGSSQAAAGTLVAAPDTGYNSFYRYRKPGVTTEYFLFENRQRTGRDAGLPSAGIAVWHVDELGNRDNQSMVPNSTHQNYELTLVQADNLWHLENYKNYGDAYDLFYDGNSAAAYTNMLDDYSSPNANWWDGSLSGMRLSDISAVSMMMSFNFGIVSTPDFALTASPTSISTVQGSSATATIATTVSGGFNYPVSLSISGLPTGAEAHFNPTIIQNPDTGSSVLTVTTASTTPVGTYTVTVTATGGGVSHSTPISFTVALPPTYTISGKVHSVSITGSALAGATVSIAGKTTTTSKAGTFSISGIPAGIYPLTISKPGYVTYTDNAYAINSNQSSLNFYLRALPTYSMSGTVRSGSLTGPVLFKAAVAIAGKTTTTGKAGTFSISGIPAGTYILTISKSGFATYTDTAYAINSNQSSLNFYLTAP